MEKIKISFGEIPLDKCEFKQNMRVRDTGKEIDDLAANIHKMGLIQPIIVCETDIEGEYEVIAGQRRFMAHEKLLEWGKLDPPTIRAKIYAGKLSKSDRMAISLSENLVKLDPKELDYIDACTDLYKRYGTIKAVCEETGLPYSKVSNYVKEPQLRPKVRTLFNEGKISLKTALHANSAVYQEGEDADEKAAELALELSKMGADQARRTRKIITENPNAKVTQAVKEAKTQTTHRVTIVQSNTEYNALNKYASESGSSPADTAGELVVDGLISLGVLDEAED